MLELAESPSSEAAASPEIRRIREALAHAAHLLPDQGPIAVFIHHNTLHAFEKLPFHEAVAKGSETYHARGYLEEDTFRALHESGRITDADLDEALREWGPEDRALGSCFESARRLQRAAMLANTAVPPEPVLRWLLAEDPDVLAHRDLWRAALSVTSGWPDPTPSHAALLTRQDLDARSVNELVHPMLVRLCAAYLDQGVAHWAMPDREGGLYRTWVELMSVRPAAPRPHWLAELDRDLASLARRSPEESVAAALNDAGVPHGRWDEHIARSLLALPGWAGMFSRLERHPHERTPGAPPAHLVDFLAVRLVLESYARRSLAAEPRDLRPAPAATGALGRAWRLFVVARRLGVSADALLAWDRPDSEGFAALDAFDEASRLRVWQEAYEGHYRAQLVAGLSQNRPAVVGPVDSARFQGVFCFDDREESLRRHFEELDPRHETFGAPGFFGVAMAFRGFEEGDFAPLCPVVVQPAHRVEELPVEPEHGARFERRRRLLARLRQSAHGSSRGLLHGLVALPLLGLSSALLLPLGLLAPRAAARIEAGLRDRLLERPETRLTAHRDEDDDPRGFSLDDQVQRVAATLQNIGLKRGFAPLVFVLGHGSTSANNPHRSAYDCGACGGRHGGPNARLFAEMANRPAVRERLAARGIEIPEGTWFIGGQHDTATDRITFADLDRVPSALRAELAVLRERLQVARGRQAQERCRRFASAPRRLSPADALRHVESRAASIGQPRPELGHVTVASGLVGRRALTRGLFLDRRLFAISYDPTQDEGGAVLERILAAAGPVGAGINLEYYFSRVDNARYGCGTKLPHNPVGLLGVMEGSSGDLRTGLPQQMIEIHEPMRLQLFVEATPATLLAICERQQGVRELVVGEWVRLVSIDPDTGAMQLFSRGAFHPITPPTEPVPRAPDSLSWCGGRDGFLPPARIEGGLRHAA
jgi:uncharacterized protein YbcC (UPF0753/DUF2309 family)